MLQRIPGIVDTNLREMFAEIQPGTEIDAYFADPARKTAYDALRMSIIQKYTAESSRLLKITRRAQNEPDFNFLGAMAEFASDTVRTTEEVLINPPEITEPGALEQRMIDDLLDEIRRCEREAEPAIDAIIRAAVAKKFPKATFERVVAKSDNGTLIAEAKAEALRRIRIKMRARRRILEWMQDEKISFSELFRLVGLNTQLHDEEE